jgi:xanthine/CO dehydrogenase XdhC/CoxF family maturation factor
VAVLSHGPKIDNLASVRVLSSEVFYIGALGSSKTQEKHRKRLLAASVEQENIILIHAPIELNLGGDTPEEIALAITAEIVQARNQYKTYESLSVTGNKINVVCVILNHSHSFSVSNRLAVFLNMPDSMEQYIS